MIDAEVYVYELLLRDFAEVDLEALGFQAGATIAADIDVDVMDNFPYLTYTLTGDGQVANGPGLWGYTLTLSFFAQGMDAAKAFARVGYDLVHAWDDNPTATPLDVDGDRVWVSSLEDIDVPSRQSSAEIGGRNVTQYVGSFGLALRNI